MLMDSCQSDTYAVVCRYYHDPGTEYLVADPVHVPRLADVFNECPQRESDLVFSSEPPQSTTTDPFAALPPELRFGLLPLLPIVDVASLRLASAAFRQLPQSYFHGLVLRNMPWIWEAQTLARSDTDWHKLWCQLSSADGGSLQDEQEREWLRKTRRAAYLRVREELKTRDISWGNPEYHKTFNELKPNFDDEADAEVKKAYAEGRIKGKKGTEINGLRNRRRIWRDCEEIVRRIGLKRDRGMAETLGSPEE